MTPTLTQVTEWFAEFNRSVFNEQLPSVRIRFNNTRCQLGQFYWGNGRGIGIKISLYWDRTEEQFRRCLSRCEDITGWTAASGERPALR